MVYNVLWMFPFSSRHGQNRRSGTRGTSEDTPLNHHHPMRAAQSMRRPKIPSLAVRSYVFHSSFVHIVISSSTLLYSFDVNKSVFLLYCYICIYALSDQIKHAQLTYYHSNQILTINMISQNSCSIYYVAFQYFL